MLIPAPGISPRTTLCNHEGGPHPPSSSQTIVLPAGDPRCRAVSPPAQHHPRLCAVLLSAHQNIHALSPPAPAQTQTQPPRFPPTKIRAQHAVPIPTPPEHLLVLLLISLPPQSCDLGHRFNSAPAAPGCNSLRYLRLPCALWDAGALQVCGTPQLGNMKSAAPMMFISPHLQPACASHHCPDAFLPQRTPAPMHHCPKAFLPQSIPVPIHFCPNLFLPQSIPAPIHSYRNPFLPHCLPAPTYSFPNTFLPQYTPAPMHSCSLSTSCCHPTAPRTTCPAVCPSLPPHCPNNCAPQ